MNNLYIGGVFFNFRIQRRVLHRFVLMANKESGGYDRLDGADEDEEAREARECKLTIGNDNKQ